MSFKWSKIRTQSILYIFSGQFYFIYIENVNYRCQRQFFLINQDLRKKSPISPFQANLTQRARVDRFEGSRVVTERIFCGHRTSGDDKSNTYFCSKIYTHRSIYQRKAFLNKRVLSALYLIHMWLLSFYNISLVIKNHNNFFPKLFF